MTTRPLPPLSRKHREILGSAENRQRVPRRRSCPVGEKPDVPARGKVGGNLVTNDAAERGVALVQDFTKNPRTKSEAQL